MSYNQVIDTITLNIIFLIVGIIAGLIIGFVIAYILERFKEKRLKKKISVVLKNEIVNCGEAAKNELDGIEKINEFPNGLQKERICLSALFLSLEYYSTILYECYMNKIFLFKDSTQKEVTKFYSLIFRLDKDLPSIRYIAEKLDLPPELVKDTYEKQKKLRELIIEQAGICEKFIKKE